MKATKTLSTAFRLIGVNALVLVGLLLILEGFSSWFLTARGVLASKPLAERLYTRYDPELGWVSEPNVRRPGLYGPGTFFSTNSRGFRGTAEFAAAVPAGKIRAICSGDSFTLGYGVSDDQAWCHVLTTLDGRLETVNMGQGGYGFDQAYLWFRRDARDLQHQLHLFAFITDDLRRMTQSKFFGYPKPLLSLDAAGHLVVANAPAPTLAHRSNWLYTRVRALQQLRLFTLVRAAAHRVRGNAAANTAPQLSTFEQTRDVLPAVLADLQRRNAAQNSRLVVIRLPTLYELPPGQHDAWTPFFRDQAAKLGFVFIDLLEPFRQLPRDSVRSLFLLKENLQFQAAAGHLNAAGNREVAALLYASLRAQGLLSNN